MRTVHLAILPTCQVCSMNGSTVTARFDSPIAGMSWGYLCDGHMAQYGNTAVASRLTDEPEPVRTDDDIRRDVRAAVLAGSYSDLEDAIGDGDIAEWL